MPIVYHGPKYLLINRWSMSLADAVLVIMLLLASGAVIAGIFRNVPIPYTVMLVLLGVSLNYIAQYWQPMQLINNFRLTPDLILFIFLPTLIFEAAFRYQRAS